MTARKWKNEFVVNTTFTGNQYQPSVAALANGGFAIAWRDDGPTDDLIRWQRFDAQGAPIGAEQSITTTTDGGNQSLPCIVQLSDGNLWIVQRDQDTTGADIEGAIFGLDGTLIRNQEPFTSATLNTDTPRIASLGAAGAVAVFRNADANGGDIQMRMADAAGVFGGTITVNTAAATLAQSQDAPDVAASPNGSRIAVVWTDGGSTGGDIKARVFNATGTQVTAEFTVNVLTADLQRAPAVAWISASKFVTVWETLDPSGDGSGFAVKYVIRNVDGTAFGSERLATAATENPQGGAAVTALPDGGFAIAWVDFSAAGGDSSSGAIKLQLFDGSGAKRESELLVNTTTATFQGEVSLATLADGRIIVTWRDDSSTGGDPELGAVRAQIIDPRDGVVNGTAAADTLYGHDTFGDEINGLDGNDVLLGLGGNDAAYGGSGDDQATLARGDDVAYGGAGADTLAGGNGEDVLYGEGDGDNLNGGKGEDELYGGAGGDTLKGGSENDIYSGDAGNDILIAGTGSDAFDGGADTDTVDYSASTTAVIAALNGGFANAGDAFGDSFTAIENITGSAFNDTLRGTGSANVIFGGAGNDRLEALGGLDTLTGGLGNDTFFINNPNDGADTITDFSSTPGSNDDRFELRGSNFNGQPVGALLANQFQSSTSNVAQSATVRFFFETDTGNLFWDRDGNAGAFNPVLIATLQIGATVTVGDFTII